MSKPYREYTKEDIFKLKAENEELKENYRLSCLKCKFKNAFMILDEIEECIETCNNTRYCKECKFSENCKYNKGWSFKKMVLQKIKEVKGND